MQRRDDEADTAIGGARGTFPVTPRSALLGASSDDPVTRGRAFARIVQAYWKPVYKHVRLRWRKSNEEAKDLTQAFFARAFEHGTFSAYDPSLAKFRTYVRRCLDNFITNAEEARTAVKRGGGLAPLSFDFDDVESELLRDELDLGVQLDDAFDREWLRGVLASCTSQLEEELALRGRHVPFRVFARYDLADDDPSQKPTYAELARELGIKTSDVSNYLNASRKRFREIVLDKLSELTGSDDELEEETRELMRVAAAS